MIICQECEAEFEVVHDSVSAPEFCPFCSAKLRYDDEGLEEEDWYPDP
jgi:predicted nucleic acid-binding Zn ribbon protein